MNTEDKEDLMVSILIKKKKGESNMYKIISIISLLIRQFYLPNPYIGYFDIELYADIFNILVGGTILHIYAYSLTSSIYDKYRHSSWVGSFLYCINYILNTFLMSVLCYKYPNLGLSEIILIAFVINLIIMMINKFTKCKIKEKVNIFNKKGEERI